MASLIDRCSVLRACAKLRHATLPDILELHIDHKHHFILYCLRHTKRAGVFHHFYFTIFYVFLFIFLYVLVFFPFISAFSAVYCNEQGRKSFISSVFVYATYKGMNEHFILNQ